MKRVTGIILALLLLLTLCACGAKPAAQEQKNPEPAAASDGTGLKVGVILLHDESIGYDFTHLQGIQTACRELGIDESTQVVWKYNIAEDQTCYDAAVDLVDQGCNVIISDSYGHQSYMTLAAEEHPEVQFLIATGDTAAVDNCQNTHNFFTHMYESRYVSGVVAGMKIKELVENDQLTAENYNEDGTIKIGYVGAFPYAEVVSGYTGFYLGVKSIVDNVKMDVIFTNSWANATAEQQAAEALLARGCCIISQHADSTGGPSAIEAAAKTGSVCYYVGFSIDMLAVAPTTMLTSAQDDWSRYYKYALALAMDGKAADIAVDWSEGYAGDANMISALGEACAEGTAEKVAEVETGIKNGTLNVFDTSKFTVNGETITSYIFNSSTMNSDYTAVLYNGADYECIENGAFQESTFRSAPYFSLLIDGINQG